MIVEYFVPKYYPSGEPERDENNEIVFEKRTGILCTWGIKTTIDEETKQAITNTVAIVEDSDGGAVIELYPSELKVI